MSTIDTLEASKPMDSVLDRVDGLSSFSEAMWRTFYGGPFPARSDP